jgi:hypothetical protein
MLDGGVRLTLKCGFVDWCVAVYHQGFSFDTLVCLV